jgi:hypothetical protein
MDEKIILSMTLILFSYLFESALANVFEHRVRGFCATTDRHRVAHLARNAPQFGVSMGNL